MKSRSEIKVAFVEPMAATNVFAKYMSIPMLGPLYLGTIARDAGYDVVILNENILKRKLRDSDVADIDILCLSCMTSTIQRGKVIAKRYKEVRKERGMESRTIVGGIHASMIPEDVLPHFDQVFVGEAEESIVPLLDGELQDSLVQGHPVQDLDTVPIPDYSLLKGWKGGITPVMTSRGCPYDCTFCSVTEMFGRGYRAMSSDRVLAEIDSLKSNKIFFVDDHFVASRKRTDDLLDRLEARKRKTKWTCQLRADVAKDEALVGRMSDNGCYNVYIGFESINQKMLEEIHKKQTVADIKNAIDVFQKNGIGVHGMFMLGSDSDDKSIFEETARFTKSTHLSTVQYMILTPLPGTEFYRSIEKQGRLLHKKWEYFDAMHVVFQPKNFTPEELQQGMVACFEDFYTYTHALGDAFNVFFQTVGTVAHSIYEHPRFPQLSSPFIKALGKHIVHQWKQFNKPYMGYLKVLSKG